MADIDKLTELINSIKIEKSFSDELTDFNIFISKIKNMYLDIFNHGYILEPENFINNYILQPHIPQIILNLKYEQREHFVNILIDELNKYKNELEQNKMLLNGGNKKSVKYKTKEVLGKLRRIYKIPNSKKEYIKHKGNLITLSDYKKFMKI
jgi:hypothetical protein